MAKKNDKRGQIPRMSTMTITQQDVLIQRWRLRKDLRAAYQEIVDAMLLWVIDNPEIRHFVATGHRGHFNMNPERDLVRRMEANGFTPKEIVDALKSNDVAADWMTPEETKSVVDRIATMKDYFDTHAPGPFSEALQVYYTLGIIARRNFIRQYGYEPEQSPIPRVKITGEQGELKKLKPVDHQPSLFGEGEEKTT